MNTCSTTDPISLHDVTDLEHHQCTSEGDDDNGIEIYFKNEENLPTCLQMETTDKVVLLNNNGNSYVAEG